MSLLPPFLHFYNHIIRRSPELALEQVIRKFVRARTLHPKLRLRFGLNLNLNLDVNNLTRMPGVVHSASIQCSKFIGNDFKEYLFQVEKPNAQASELLNQLTSLNKIWTDSEFVNSAPPGSYTFMIGSTENGVAHVYALRAFTYHEIGTKHCQILERVTVGPERMSVLHYAGEMHVRVRNGTRSIDFNLSSGTYMRGETEPELEKTSYEPEIVKLLSSFVQPDKTVRIKFGSKVLLSGIVTPREAIWMYLIAGMKILIFKSDQECARYAKSAQQPRRVIDKIDDELIRDNVVVTVRRRQRQRRMIPVVAPKMIVRNKNLKQAQPLKLGVAKIDLCPVVPTAPLKTESS